MVIPKPCLICGILTIRGSRCPTHRSQLQKETDQRRKEKRNHYKGSYQSRAKKVREEAVTCHICNEGYKFNDPFQADHLIPGVGESPLLPAHRSCNIRKGNKFR